MTETTTILTGPPPDAPKPAAHPSDVMPILIATLLAPMYLSATGGDLQLARIVATETINAYRIRDQPSVLAAAQFIGFSIATLGSLGLSMTDGLSLAMTVRLRSNANALSRSAEKNRQALGHADISAQDADDPAGIGQDDHLRPAPIPARDVTTRQTAAVASHAESDPARAVLRDDPPTMEAALDALAAASQRRIAEAEADLRSPRPRLATRAPRYPGPTENEFRRTAWSHAMTGVAGEITVATAGLPPSERRSAGIHAAALTSAANQILPSTTHPLQPIRNMPSPGASRASESPSPAP